MKINFPYNQDLLKLNEIFNKNNQDNLRIVGGAVRNFLLNREIVDFDLSTTFTPTETQKILNENNIKNIPTGVNFGTITAVFDKKTYEITSTRKDIKTDGRHAIVEYTKDFKIDAERRDFTFNALYLDFNNNVYDYFNGISDLKKGIVRFIGNAESRIKEDYLRILRFFRFYTYYGNVLDNEGLKYSILYRDKLNSLSAERIKTEMFKIFNAKFPLDVLKIMFKNEILQIITDIKNFDFNFLEYFYSIREYLLEKSNTELAISLFLNNQNDLEILKNKWKLSNKEYQLIKYLFNHKQDKKYDLDKIKEIIFLNGKNYIQQLIIQNGIINQTSINEINGNLDFTNNIILPKLPINGNDLFSNGFTDKSKYNNLLNIAKNIFITSNYSLKKEEIIKKLKKL